jgi:hypothetical protein
MPYAKRRLRMAPVDRRKGLQPVEARGLKPALPLIEPGPLHAALATSLGHVPEFPGRLQHAQTLMSVDAVSGLPSSLLVIVL